MRFEVSSRLRILSSSMSSMVSLRPVCDNGLNESLKHGYLDRIMSFQCGSKGARKRFVEWILEHALSRSSLRWP